MPVFKLTLEKTYYTQGFFNVKKQYDGFVRATEGPVELILGMSGERIQAKVDRSANKNGTARIRGKAKLRDYFQAKHKCGDVIDVDFKSVSTIEID